MVERIRSFCTDRDRLWAVGAIDFSAGIVEFDPDETAQGLLKRSDAAMYEQKESRRAAKIEPRPVPIDESALELRISEDSPCCRCVPARRASHLAALWGRGADVARPPLSDAATKASRWPRSPDRLAWRACARRCSESGRR